MEHQRRISLQPVRISTYYGFFCNFWSPNRCRPLCYFPNMKWCKITHHILLCNCVHVHVTNISQCIFMVIQSLKYSHQSVYQPAAVLVSLLRQCIPITCQLFKNQFSPTFSLLLCFDIIIVTDLLIF